MSSIKKIKRKNGIALLVVLTLFVFCLTACGSKKGQTDSEIKISSVDDLVGKNIGVQIGTVGDTYASDYEGDEEGTVITRFNKGADAVQALKQNKVDCVIIDEQPAKAFIEKTLSSPFWKKNLQLRIMPFVLQKKILLYGMRLIKHYQN